MQHAVFGLTLLLLTASGSEACHVLQLHTSGLGAHINELWQALPALHATNGSLYLDNKLFPYRCSESRGWTDFFQSEEGWMQPWTAEVAAKEDCEYIPWGDWHLHARALIFDYGLAHYDPTVVRKTWVLEPSLQKEVNEAIAQLESYAKPTIAFHVRGGDKATEDEVLGRKTTHPSDLVNTFVDNFWHVRGGTCLLIGDDHAAIGEMERLAREHIKCRPVRSSKYYRPKGHNQAAFNSLPLHERCKATKDLIVDLELMAHADYFVGSSTSGIPSVIATLRMSVYDKPQITYADVGYHDMGNRIRRYYSIGGFKNRTIAMDTSKRRTSQRRLLAAAL